MGDRSGLNTHNRTNGFMDEKGYMQAKKHKLACQNEEIREVLIQRHKSMKTDLFKGISINVNGRTKPTADELKRLVLLNGGEYHPYYRYQTTKFMIATNLAFAKIKQLRPDDRIVRPEWITDSIAQNKLLPYKLYQIFSDQPRGKSNVIEIDTDTSSLDCLVINDEEASNHLRRQFKKQNLKQNSVMHREAPKSKDIRDMFTKATKNLEISQPTSSNYCKAKNNNFDDNSNSSNETLNNTAASQIPEGKPPILLNQPGRANICGLTDMDSIISLLSEWVGCPEGIVDEDIACATKYFLDLMEDNDYHNKLFEIIDCFRGRVMDHGEKIWLELFNNIIGSIKCELSQGNEASQNLNQMLYPIELDEFESREMKLKINDESQPSTSTS